MSHSGDDAPLHSLRGPSTGEMRPKSDRETELGSSRLQGLEGDGEEAEEEEQDGVGDGQAEEEEAQDEDVESAKEHGDWSS